LLAALVVLLIVMFASVLGGNIVKPADWHKSFKVGLGLDLSWGTQVTLKAVPPKGHAVTPGAMAKAKSIMFDRINATGFTGASVVEQGTNEIVVSVPHQNAEAVAHLVGSTAELAFRQVLFAAPNWVAPTATTPTPSPSPTPSGSAKPSPTPTPSGSGKSSASPSASSGGTANAVGASQLSGKAATPKAKASATPSATPTATPTPTSSASPAPSTALKLSTTADGAGDLSLLTPQTIKDFDRLNCSDKKWQSAIYGSNPNGWNRTSPPAQAVACTTYNKVVFKYAMAVPVIVGTDLSSVSAQVAQSGGGYQVNFGVKDKPAQALAALTETMSTKYYPNINTDTTEASAFLAQLAVVLDGQIQSSPDVQGQISTSGEINGGSSGGFTQGQANQLANILKYGQLPLSFSTLDQSSVSPQLGSAQLSAGIIAGLVGLLLVVIYSFIYYRGLAIVSVTSLAIAASVTYLAVVLLSKHASFNMTLAGIAGLIVAIGITADSFIVYFERLRDEVREGRSLRAAVERGWTRARRTILVSDTVSFLAALLLYIFAIGDVRGFAFTLGLTTLVDVVVVFLFTKPMLTLLARTKFFGQGHKMSGLDPNRLGARAPWRGGRRPATGSASGAPTTPKEA
jgi:preprotein translocase subunit SecD